MFLTRRANGLYLLTKERPVITEIGDTGILDAYSRPGDPLSINNICDWARERVFRAPPLELLESVPVTLRGRTIGEVECLTDPQLSSG